MSKPFVDFDFTSFWEESEYAREHYVSKSFTEDGLQAVQKELGYTLPPSYVAMMRIQNGGIPVNCAFPINSRTTWASDHIAISGIYGIGSAKVHSLCGEIGSQFMIEEWGYPPLGIYFANCPSAGHDMVGLDYSQCGPHGEPEVVHVDQEWDFQITVLAPNYESFIRGLVPDSAFS